MQEVRDMKVEQISVFLENRPGALEATMKVLAEADINIRALSLADTTDFGILRLIVNDVDKAKAALKEHDVTTGRTEVVAVEVPDKPGGLYSILAEVGKSGVNVEYMYAYVQRSGENAVMIFRFDQTEEAIRVLSAAGFTVLRGEKVYGL